MAQPNLQGKEAEEFKNQLETASAGIQLLDFIVSGRDPKTFQGTIPDGLKSKLMTFVPFVMKSDFFQNSEIGKNMRAKIEQEVNGMTAEKLLTTLKNLPKQQFLHLLNPKNKDAADLRKEIKDSIDTIASSQGPLNLSEAFKHAGFKLTDSLSDKFKAVTIDQFKDKDVTALTDEQTIKFLGSLPVELAKMALDKLSTAKDDDGNEIKITVPTLASNASRDAIEKAIREAVTARAKYEDKQSMWVSEADARPKIMDNIRAEIARMVKQKMPLMKKAAEDVQNLLDDPKKLYAFLHDKNNNETAINILDNSLPGIKKFLKDPKNSAFLINMMPSGTLENDVAQAFIGKIQDLLKPGGPLGFLAPLIKQFFEFIEPYAKQFGVDIRYGASGSKNQREFHNSRDNAGQRNQPDNAPRNENSNNGPTSNEHDNSTFSP